jgi:hypothetical protein
MKNNYTPHNWIYCIDAYVDPEGEWMNCPKCNLRPKVWIFDNGRSTACGCWEDMYRHFSIHAESIMSIYKWDNGSLINHDLDGLRRNWNHWCKTGEILFDRTKARKNGRW